MGVQLLCFFLSALLSASALAATRDELCRQRVESRTCVMAFVPNNAFSPGCEAVREYQARVLATYDAYPPYLRRVLCELERIAIVEQGLPQGASGAVRQARQPNDRETSYEVLLNRDLFEADLKRPLNVRAFLQWKERKFFGDPTPIGPADDAGDKLRVLAELAGPDSWLDFVLTHELGHVVESQYGLARQWRGLPWEPAPGRWKKNFPTNVEMVAGGVFATEQATFLYSILSEGATATLYGSSSSREDFAEHFALYTLSRDRGLRLRISLPNTGDQEIDLIQHLLSPSMQGKALLLRKTVTALQGKAKDWSGNP